MPSESVDPDLIREAIRRCPSAGSGSWVVGMSVRTRAGETIEGEAAYLADCNTAVVVTAAGERRIAITEIVNVLSHLESPGPE